MEKESVHCTRGSIRIKSQPNRGRFLWEVPEHEIKKMMWERKYGGKNFLQKIITFISSYI